MATGVDSGGLTMLDLATRRELAALAYERAETESEQDVAFLADDGEEHFGSTRSWYDALLLCRACARLLSPKTAFANAALDASDSALGRT